MRRDAGVFDVSHMGEFEVEGPRATELLQATLSNNLDKLRARAGAVHALDERPRRDHRRPDRLSARRLPLFPRRQRGEPRDRLRLAEGTRDSGLRRPRRLRRVRAAGSAGPARDRAAGPAAGATVHVCGGGDRRRPVHGQPHRLHGRGGLRADGHGGGRGQALGCSARARSRPLRARRPGHASARGVLPVARQRHRAGHRRDLRGPRVVLRSRQGVLGSAKSCAR